jgi:8-amino-7-oxononanoate synthase
MDLFDKMAGLPSQHEQIVAVGHDPFGVRMDDIRSATEAVVEGRNVVLAGTNNYLGLTFDPACIEAAQDALSRHGTGTTGSRIANGTYAEHCALEDEIAAFFGFASAMVFPTGYQANLGVIAALAGPDDYILIDADCHACIYDGCRMTGATVIRFRHNNPADLEKRLQRLDSKDSNKLIIVEGLYSMFGDIAPLAEFAEIKCRYNAYLYVDEAHSVGTYGEHGRGVAEHAGVLDQIDFVVGTFSKSLGSIGGFGTSNHPKFPYLRFASRPYMFTASLSPSNVASVTTALRRLRSDPSLKERLWSNARTLYQRLGDLGLTLAAPPGPIVAVKIPNQELAVRCWNKLLEAGVYVNLAIPPGTPNSTSLLRCSASTAHTPEQIDWIAEAFAKVAEELAKAEPTAADQRYAVSNPAE